MTNLKEYYNTSFKKEDYPSFETLSERHLLILKKSIGFSVWKFGQACKPVSEQVSVLVKKINNSFKK